LTGITNEQIAADGIAFPDALGGFLEFAGSDQLYAFGLDHVVIAENCELNGLPSPVDDRFHNMRPVLAPVLGDWIMTAQSGSVPERLGLPPTVGCHNALADAAAVGTVLRYLLEKGRLPHLPGYADA
jgi:DNA polymerase III epsilon subunit-like protein